MELVLAPELPTQRLRQPRADAPGTGSEFARDGDHPDGRGLAHHHLLPGDSWQMWTTNKVRLTRSAAEIDPGTKKAPVRRKAPAHRGHYLLGAAVMANPIALTSRTDYWPDPADCQENRS